MYRRLRLVLVAAGLAIAAYLTLIHFDADVPLVCAGGSVVNCEAVLSSGSSVVLGVPVAAWGLLWFAVALALALQSFRGGGRHDTPTLRTAGLAWALAGMVTVLWLVYQEIGVVGKICAWCTAVHVLVLALLVVEVRAYEVATSLRVA